MITHTKILGALAAAACLFTAPAATAEPWTDWSPEKGVVMETRVHVEPGHLDDYLSGLKKTWVPHEELLMKKGVIVHWAVQVRDPQLGDGPNVSMLEWYPSLAKLEPDQALDKEMMAQDRAIMSKDEATKTAGDRAKYRTFADDQMWVAIDFPK